MVTRLPIDTMSLNVTSRVIVVFSLYRCRLPPYHHYHLCLLDSVLDIAVIVNKKLGKFLSNIGTP